jgi:membrane-bound lytic murein transglycosylase D
VQPGDNLSTIADDYDSTVNELRKMNKLKRGNMLRVGMRLKVPSDDEGLPVAPDSDKVVPSRGPQALAPIAHIVKPGETLFTIAQKYGVTVEALKKANNLKKKSVLRVGVRLMIPVSAHREQVNARKTQTAMRIAGHRHKTLARAKPRIHVVKRGENLSHIADKYQVTVADLRSKNRSVQGSKLFVGARLLIPVANARE